MNKFKMVALDLDGTTLNRESKITERTCAALHNAMEKGVHVVISTGRAFDAIPEEVLSVDRKCIYTNHIDENAVIRVVDLFKTSDLSGLYIETVINRKTLIGQDEYDLIVSGRSSFRGVSYVKATRTPVKDIFECMIENRHKIENINIIFKTQELKARWRKIFEQIPDTTVTTSFEANLEIGGATTSKAEALRFLMKKLQVKREELLACGDSPNDENMLRFAGLGVAMGNALPEVKEAADYVTSSNEEDGVAEVIEKFIL